MRLSWKRTKVKSVIFSEKRQWGPYIFPADLRLNHHSKAAVGDSVRSSVLRFTFKWNQMIYSNDDGNKSKFLFHIGLEVLSFWDFAGTGVELFLCYVKAITFTFQCLDSSTLRLWGLMLSAHYFSCVPQGFLNTVSFPISACLSLSWHLNVACVLTKLENIGVIVRLVQI